MWRILVKSNVDILLIPHTCTLSAIQMFIKMMVSPVVPSSFSIKMFPSFFFFLKTFIFSSMFFELTPKIRNSTKEKVKASFE